MRYGLLRFVAVRCARLRGAAVALCLLANLAAACTLLGASRQPPPAEARDELESDAPGTSPVGEDAPLSDALESEEERTEEEWRPCRDLARVDVRATEELTGRSRTSDRGRSPSAALALLSLARHRLLATTVLLR